MRIAILSANLNNFDDIKLGVGQTGANYTYQCFTDENFPPIAGLTPRFQYRIPKYFGWQMLPGYDVYLWLDGSMALTESDMLQKWVDALDEHDMVVFKHPWRNSIQEESDHIEEHLKRGKGYIHDRYQNGLHKEQLEVIQATNYNDDHLYASMAFMYRNTPRVQGTLSDVWQEQARYFTCDQLAFTFCLQNLEVVIVEDSPFKSDMVSLVSKHG